MKWVAFGLFFAFALVLSILLDMWEEKWRQKQAFLDREKHMARQREKQNTHDS